MNPFKVLRIVAILFGTFVLFYALADGNCRANADDGLVYVDPGVKDASQVKERITERLQKDDEIVVRVMPEGEYADPFTNGVIFLWSEGKDVKIKGNDWVPQVFLDDRLERIRNVTRRPVDQIVRMIDEIHSYQDGHARPERQAPVTVQITTAPPTSPGPPPPPPEPEEPSVFTRPYVWGPLAGLGVLIIIWLPLHLRYLRRKKLAAEISHRAEVQADWGLNEYHIKTTLD